jgi:hypothetical protein
MTFESIPAGEVRAGDELAYWNATRTVTDADHVEGTSYIRFADPPSVTIPSGAFVHCVISQD